MAYCAECGARIPEGAKFCVECGAAVPVRQMTAAAPGNMASRADRAVQDAALVAETLAHTETVEAPDVAGEFLAGTWSYDVLPSADAVAAQAAQVARGAARTSQAHRSGGTAPEPLPKRRSRLPVMIAAVVVVALVAVVALYVVPLFIPHPHDPHEDMALTSETAPSPSDEPAGSESASPSTPKESESASPSDPTAQEEPAAPQSFSTDERPKLVEFAWIAGPAAKGSVPKGATRLTGFGDVEGGWKGYLYSGDSEWLLNARIDSAQDGAAVAIDWYYLRVGGASGEVRKDDTPDSQFSGSWASGQLDATGSGRIVLESFWQQDDHQYATGSFTWPDGENGTIALMRP